MSCIVLFTYRNTPHTVINRKPSELLLNCEVRTRFSLLRPNIQQRVESKQNDEIAKRNVNRKVRQFVEGEKVRILNVRSNYPKWYYGRIVKCLNAVRYLVKIGYRECQVHIDHLMERFDDDETGSIPNSDVDLDQTKVVEPSNQSKNVVPIEKHS
ncbi:hypothetical protein LOTGIDRAFT_175564 [Lottia gigantea]|uniref:Uncharacterized protein n=1 Tax=Lottia gigantea TaxID=225164 RepID=V4AE89_LOTGI|nr:hypothetical protein LOTGIDRAFT_175564 [Lottia gigantea]ESO93440.1 hypothetical protein LOTGIDRAFT_175564 [Lottia gigantea]